MHSINTIHADGRVVFSFEHPQTCVPFGVAINCPIAASLHERQAALRSEHRAWARRFDLFGDSERYERYCATRFDELIGYQYHGWSLELAVVASHLMTWFFVFDDNMDIDHALEPAAKRYTLALAKRHVDLLEGGTVQSGDPSVVLAFADFLAQVRALAGARHSRWYQRMTHHLKEYVYGTIWECTAGPTTAERANTATYMQVRHMAVGVAPCHDLMALAADVDARAVDGSFFVQRLERLAINYSIWINDLAGLSRDLKSGLANVIFTLQKDHSLSLEEGAGFVARMCDGELAAYFQLEAQLPVLLESWSSTSRDVLAYADVLRRWMRGLLDWSARSARYQRLEIDMSLQSADTIQNAASKYASSIAG